VNNNEPLVPLVDGAEVIDVAAPPSVGSNIDDWFAFQEVFRRVLASAHEELHRSKTLLFWSGTAAGLSLGLTFIARATFTGLTGETDPGFVGNLLYPIGFVLIVVGRYQLFTENTLTPVALVLTRLADLGSLLRLWVIVLAGNLLGATVMAALLAWTGVLTPEATAAATAIGSHVLEVPLNTVFGRAVIAGWIVASMVWLLHAVRDDLARIVVVWALMFVVGVADLFHVITGTLEVLYLLFDTGGSWMDSAGFFVAVLSGNVLGGVVFVTVVNTAQFGREDDGEMVERLRRSAERDI